MKCIDLIGNVGRNAERVTATTGKELMKFSLAISNRDGSTMWCSVISNLREGIFPYIVKGKQLFVRGDFDVKLYNGVPTIDVYADRIELIGAKVETTTTAVTESAAVPQGEKVQESDTY